MELVSTSHPRIDILHEVINEGHNVIFLFVGIR